jgi:hypothetical protein
MAKKRRFRVGLMKLISEVGWGVTAFIAFCLLVPFGVLAVLFGPELSSDVGGCKKIATFTLSDGEEKSFSLKDGNQLVIRASNVVGPTIQPNGSTGGGERVVGNSMAGTWTIGDRSGQFSLRDTDSATVGLAKIASSSYSSSIGKPSSVRLRLGDCTSPAGTK